MDPNYHEDIVIRQLTEHFDGLNSMFCRITCNLQELHEDNAALQRRIGKYEDTEWLHIQLEGQVDRLVRIYERMTCTIKDLQKKKAALQTQNSDRTGIEGLEKCSTDPSDHEDIVWLHTKVMDLFNGLNSIFGRIACTIRELQDGKVTPQNKIWGYEDVGWLYTQLSRQVNGLYRIRKHMVRTIEGLQDDNAALQIAVEDLKQSTTDPRKHEDFEWLDTQITDQERGLNMINKRISDTIRKLQAAFHNGTKGLEQCPMNPSYNKDIEWLQTQVRDQVNKCSNITDTIQKLLDDKATLQSRIEVLEQGDLSVDMEMRRLREENSTLRGQLATAAKEKLKITWEHDPPRREGIKWLVDGPLVHLDDASTISRDGNGVSPQLYRLREVSSHFQNMTIHTSDPGESLIPVPATIAPSHVALPSNAVPWSRIVPFCPTGNITMPCLRARGIVNTGNMCFVNAILQLLVHCPSFWELGVVGRPMGKYGAEKSQNSDAGMTPLVDATLRFLGEFVYKKKEHNAVDSFEPTYMYEEMKRKARLKELLDNQQQDAEDFFYAYLRALDEELDSPILPKFTSMLRSTAPQIGFDPVQDWGWLSLDVLNSSVCTIEDALVLFSQSGQSGSGEASNTKVLIVSLPPVLVLCLNRTVTVNNTASPGKVNIIKEAKSIPFSTMLDIPPGIMAATARPLSGPARYKLSGVLYHHGESTGNGHYTVDVRHPDTEGGSSDVWQHIDDETVNIHLDLKDEFPESYRARARDQCSTMLFYHRTSIRTVTTHQKAPDLINFD